VEEEFVDGVRESVDGISARGLGGDWNMRRSCTHVVDSKGAIKIKIKNKNKKSTLYTCGG